MEFQSEPLPPVRGGQSPYALAGTHSSRRVAPQSLLSRPTGTVVVPLGVLCESCSDRRRPKNQQTAEKLATVRREATACDSVQQRVVILVRDSHEIKGLSQLDKRNMWSSLYEKRPVSTR